MFKKFKTMSKEKEINIEDGNVQETVQNENNEQTTQNENTEENQNTDNKTEKGDNNTDAADKKAEEAAILPILDDFERAIADKSEDPKAIKEGVKMIFNKFVKTLEGLGVKKIETNDKDFDVDFHEAIAMVPGMGDDKKGKIIDCVQTGYTMNDKVIRHAKVAVGQ